MSIIFFFSSRKVIDQRTESGKIYSEQNKYRTIYFRTRRSLSFSRLNIIKIFSKKNRQKFYVYIEDFDKERLGVTDLDTDIYSHTLERKIYQEAAFRFLSRAKKNITKILFNSVLRPDLAAVMDAADQLRIPTSLKSHGGIFPGGLGPERKLTELLSASGYNSYPSAGDLEPRLNWLAVQEKNGNNKRKIISSRPFILFAPNYQPFTDLIPAFSPTSFDVVDYAKHLADLADELNFDLGIRIKYSASGTERQKNQNFRMISANSINKIVDSHKNCYLREGKFIEEMNLADLILTCGNTAVTFDALSMNKKVAILRKTHLPYRFCATNKICDENKTFHSIDHVITETELKSYMVNFLKSTT